MSIRWLQGARAQACAQCFVAVLLVGLFGLLLLPLPFGRDQGIYAHGGSLVLRGNVLYRDTWQNPCPAIYWTYALAEALFGHRIVSIRLVEWAALLVSCCLAGWVARALLGRRAGYAAMAAYALAYVPLDPWCTAQPECFANVFGLAGLGLLVNKLAGGRRWGLLLAGCMFGVAVWYKLTLALWPVALAAYLLVRRARDNWRRGVLDGVAFAAGVGVVLAVGMGYFLAAGAWGDLVSQVGTYNIAIYRETARYHSLFAWLRGLADITLATFLSANWAGFTILAAATTLWLLVTRTGKAAAPALLMGVAAVLSVFAQPHHWTHHWIPVLPSLSILAAPGLAAALRWAREAGDDLRTWVLGAVVLVALAGAGWPWVTRAWDAARVAIGLRPAAEFYERFSTYGRGDFSFVAELEVAAYLKAHSSPDDLVQIWGFEQGINFLAERLAPTRFGTIWPFVLEAREHPLIRQWFAEFLAEFDRTRPLYVVVVEQDYSPVQRVDSKTALGWYPAMAERLISGYRVETVIEHFTLYRRVD